MSKWSDTLFCPICGWIEDKDVTTKKTCGRCEEYGTPYMMAGNDVILLRHPSEDIKKFYQYNVYSPISWQQELGYTVDLTRCRYSVHHGRFGSHQCGRKPKEQIHHWSYCSQHAKMAREK